MSVPEERRSEETARINKKRASKPLCIKVFKALSLARLPRFERGTFRLGGGRSILLSYRRVS